MQTLRYLAVSATLLTAGLASHSIEAARARVRIENDRNDCVNGWLSMDVSVYVDNERFDFDPSCSFSFDKRFTTRDNLECRVSAGMCSSFSPHERIEVSCDDGSGDSVTVDCPDNN